MERSRKKGFQPIRGVLTARMERHAINRQLEARRVLDVSRRVLAALWGEERAAFCAPAAFADGTLTFRIRSAAALQTLRMDEVRYMNALNRELGERRVLKIIARREGF